MSEGRIISVLIADDEPAARRRLQDLLESEIDVRIVGQVANGTDAVRAIRRLGPDLVFLDVEMPGLTGVEVVREIGTDAMPAVIFVTAYDRYAVNAFDLAAVDYLLKPFDDDRFSETLARVRRILAARDAETLRDSLSVLLGGASPLAPGGPGTSTYLERIGVEMRGQIRVVPIEDIAFITANGDYVELHVGHDTFLVRERLQSLEKNLDPRRFHRIHRSTIVRLDQVESVLHGRGGKYAVVLRNGKRLRVSRGRYESLQASLGVRLPG